MFSTKSATTSGCTPSRSGPNENNQARLLDGGLRQCNNCRVHLVNLETFVCVAELGGMTPAARSLGIPKSTVARRVERLEAELGVALVQRIGRGLALTDDGRALVERCAASLREIQAVEDTLTDSSARPSGKLSVALPLDGSVSAGLISLVTTFSSDFSAVRVRLHVQARLCDLRWLATS